MSAIWDFDFSVFLTGALADANGRILLSGARSSAVEHTLHTGGVTGSIPVAPTMIWSGRGEKDYFPTLIFSSAGR
jgi:hypothetical protein